MDCKFCTDYMHFQYLLPPGLYVTFSKEKKIKSAENLSFPQKLAGIKLNIEETEIAKISGELFLEQKFTLKHRNIYFMFLFLRPNTATWMAKDIQGST